MAEGAKARRRNLQEALREATNKAAGNSEVKVRWIILEDYMEANRKQIEHDFTREHPGEQMTESYMAEKALDMMNRQAEKGGTPIVYMFSPHGEEGTSTQVRVIIPASMDTPEHNMMKDDMPTVNHYVADIPDFQTLGEEERKAEIDRVVAKITRQELKPHEYYAGDSAQETARQVMNDARGTMAEFNVIDTNGKMHKVQIDARTLGLGYDQQNKKNVIGYLAKGMGKYLWKAAKFVVPKAVKTTEKAAGFTARRVRSAIAEGAHIDR